MYKRNTQSWMKHIDFLLLDILSLHISLELAFYIRHGVINVYDNPIYRNMALVMTLMALLAALFMSTFKNVLKRGYYQELSVTLKHIFLVELLSLCYLYITQSAGLYSRVTFCLTGILYAAISYISRIFWKLLLKKRLQGIASDSLLIVTFRDMAEKEIENIREKYSGSYHLAGLALMDRHLGEVKQKKEFIAGVEVVADAKSVISYACRTWVDEVLISLPKEESYPSKLISQFQEMGIVVHYQLVEEVDANGPKQIIERLGQYTVLTSSINYATPVQMLIKRMVDIIGGIIGCMATVVLFFILAPFILIQSPGPVFFSQVRVGKNGKKFKIYKFRSMYLDAEEQKEEMRKENHMEDDLMFKVHFDRRIIGCRQMPDGRIKKGIGNLIREYSLDEFPQFFNVLKGDMSLVGTRPPTVDEWERYKLHHRARLAVKPGITGLWQVSGRSGIMDFEEVVALDTKYISEWSMGLDFQILLRTIKVVLKREGAM